MLEMLSASHPLSKVYIQVFFFCLKQIKTYCVHCVHYFAGENKSKKLMRPKNEWEFSSFLTHGTFRCYQDTFESLSCHCYLYSP